MVAIAVAKGECILTEKQIQDGGHACFGASSAKVTFLYIHMFS